MDALSIIIVVAVIGAAIFLFKGKKEDSKGSSEKHVATPDVGKTPVTKPKKEDAPAKKAPAKKAPAKKAPAKAKLPSDTQLQKNTKGQLEELGRKHGIELDKRKTKANMIAELKTKFKQK